MRRIRYREDADEKRIYFFLFIVISTKEKSPREALQRLDFRCGVTCEDFSFVEMTKIVVILDKNKKNPHQSASLRSKSVLSAF